MKKASIAAVLLTVSLPLFFGPAFAREHEHSATPKAGDEHAAHGMMAGMCPMMAMSQRTDGVLAFLKVELALTSSQRQEWDDFAEAYREAKSHEGQMHAPGGMMEHGDAPRSLPDRMAQHAKMMEMHLAALKALQGPTAQLYAALDGDQKKTADELIPMFLMCRMM